VEESCTRCGRHICNDCRIRKEEEPFCSAWCQRLYRLEEILDAKDEPETRLSIPDQFKRLIPLADSLIAFVICLLALYSYINISAKNLDTILTEAERKGADQKTVNALKKSVEIPPAPAPEYVVQVQVEEIITDRPQKPELKKKTYRAVRKPAPDGSINRVRGAGKRLAITFDGGSNDASASEILNILQKKDIQTTLFLTARFIKLYPNMKEY